MERDMLKPQTSDFGSNAMLLKGISISTYQPRSSREVRADQIVSQSSSTRVLSLMRASRRAPRGLTTKL